MQKCPQCGEIYLNPIGAKLYEALADIKEIAEDFGFNGTYESYKTAIDQILQKISEVENDR